MKGGLLRLPGEHRSSEAAGIAVGGRHGGDGWQHLATVGGADGCQLASVGGGGDGCHLATVGGDGQRISVGAKGPGPDLGPTPGDGGDPSPDVITPRYSRSGTPNSYLSG